MTEDVRSYSKTVALILVAGLLLALAGFVALRVLGASTALAGTAWAVVGIGEAMLALAAISGLLVVYRTRRILAGRGDLFLALNEPRSEQAFRRGARPVALRWLRRLLGAPSLIVGDSVRVKPLSDIKATLDSSGCLEGMPFMAEMERFCGQRGRVFRIVDKVYDYGGKKDFRRSRDLVLLHGLRCDGSAHGECQAGCYLLWKTAWLAPTPRGDDGAAHAPARAAERRRTAANDGAVPDTTIYRCQFTEIVASSQPLSDWDIRQYLRPVVAGNLTVLAFLTTLGTLLFGVAQRLRGGIGFPWLRPGTSQQSVSQDLHLGVGETVRVRSADEIARTLNNRGRNKGLWFDRDMLKHVGQPRTVLARVEKIIDDATGKMLRMKSPCILLEDVNGSGEFMRFCAQHDYVFWREAWLARADERTSASSRSQ